VQLAQRERRRHQHAPPYHRADPDQPDLDLKDLVGIRRRRRAAAGCPGAAAVVASSREVTAYSSVRPAHPRDPDASPIRPSAESSWCSPTPPAACACRWILHLAPRCHPPDPVTVTML
jgi:hypothetical protein